MAAGSGSHGDGRDPTPGQPGHCHSALPQVLGVRYLQSPGIHYYKFSFSGIVIYEDLSARFKGLSLLF